MDAPELDPVHAPAGDDPLLIVGGGIAGLVVARERVLLGEDVVVLEAQPRAGGWVGSHSVAGMDLDAGVDSFALRGSEPLGLLTTLRLEGDVVTPATNETWVHRADGTTGRLPEESLFGIPGVPLAQDVIAAIGMGAAWRAQLDTLLPSLVGSRATDVAEFVRRRMGRGVLEQLVAPAVRGVTGVDPSDLPLDDLHPALRATLLREGTLAQAVQALRARAETEPLVASLRGGVHRLLDALLTDLDRFGVPIRTGVEVVAVDATGVTTATGGRITGRPLLATPGAGVEAGRRIRTVTLAVDAPKLADAPRGGGVGVAAGTTDVAALALDHLSARWAWLAEANPLQFLRLTYPADAPADAERAHQDAERLLGVSLPTPEDSVTSDLGVVNPHPLSAHAIDGMQHVGEAEDRRGIAAVVAHARHIGRKSAPDPDVHGV